MHTMASIEFNMECIYTSRAKARLYLFLEGYAGVLKRHVPCL